MTKHQVREFYDQIGWQQVDQGLFQNARYEDLRPVSQEYIQRCHERVSRHLSPAGRFLLDAGSGPIQYEAYLSYSAGYTYRVCADISSTALKEARKKIGDHGLFVVADIANLPFKQASFDGLVTLHTIHHLPLAEHAAAYAGLYRVLARGRSGVIVNGWSRSVLMDPFRSFSKFRKRLWLVVRRLLRRGESDPGRSARPVDAHLLAESWDPDGLQQAPADGRPARKTFVEKHDPGWFRRTIMPRFEVEIWVWRSASVHFLKNYISERWGGRRILRLLFRLEERFPRFFGERGTYPLIVLRKP